ncbi:MAG: hypothetical protein VX642_10845 [Bdellovibrionota bacterium]|nr:hypothetical protein [Bdellovibrionota bacterium]
MGTMHTDLVGDITKHLKRIISETNGITLNDTLELSAHSDFVQGNKNISKLINEFRRLLSNYQEEEIDIYTLLNHPVSDALFCFFKDFPLPYQEAHTHLTGSLTADFIFPHLKKLLEGPHKEIYEKKITDIYGQEALPINTMEDVDKLIRLKEGEYFDKYLKILTLPKLILTSKQIHSDAAYHMAKEVYTKYNVGMLRLKFTLNRESTSSEDQIPGLEDITGEDVVLGLYDGFMKFKKEFPKFHFILAPSFRKEADFFDGKNFERKEDHFMSQVDYILDLIDKYPFLADHLNEVDTVGSERDLYRKRHFKQMQYGFRKLQYKGFKLRSHHGETWYSLRKGVQAVDNAMNIWHIDTLEHGLSLGINPNYFFHSMYQRVMRKNRRGEPIKEGSSDYLELMDMDWYKYQEVRDKLVSGIPLEPEEEIHFVKTKFHMAREVEHYQHDVLNRMITKGVALTALPSSNNKLTRAFDDYKDHPFSWWEKKGVNLSVGTDNYVTLNTNFIREMLILLYSDPDNLKITKLLMVTTGESHRPLISQLLWKMRKIKS